MSIGRAGGGGGNLKFPVKLKTENVWVPASFDVYSFLPFS